MRQTVFGQMVNVTTCPTCHGRGSEIPDPCRRCGGSGQTRAEKKVKISVPAGVDTGQKLRLMGEGEPGERGGQRGDLYVVIHVRGHEFFQRDGLSVYCEVPISFIQAAMGDEMEVPTLYGTEKLKIPGGTQTGTVFRLRGKGFPHLRGRDRGDQYVMVKVITPKRLDSKQKKLLMKFAESVGEEIHKPQIRIFKKIMEMLK